MRIHRMFSVLLLLLFAAGSSWAGTIHVPGDQPTIQAAIDAASQYDTVLIAAGVYDEPLNIDTRSDLVIAGVDAATTILKASTTLPWNVASYGSSRQTMVRIVTSTNITLSNLTLDCDLIKGNNVMGILLWDAGGSVKNNILKNMSVADASGGYYEITAYVRAISYTDLSRAEVSFTGNTFVDPGRVGIVAHGFVDIDVVQNTFYKTTSDFGYAMEIGSQSVGSVSGNIIHGYNTPAASDGSNSAGIYIENAYTAGTVGLTKSVSVVDNEVYDCQWALYAGNEFDGYAGDVDMELTVSGNNFHDNLDGAVIVTDEDRENGSSVTAAFENNTLSDNGAYGYFIFSRGDGDITATLEGDFVNSQDTGIYLADYATTVSASSYQLTVSGCDLSGNASYGVVNDYAAVTVNASGNWWGSSDPSVVSGDIAGEVDYTPWLASGSDSDPGSAGFQGDFSAVWVDDDSPQSGTTGRVSEGIELVSGSTVNVAPGTYEEQIRIDGKSVDLVGAGIGNSIIEAVPVANRVTYSVTQWNGSARTIDACIGITGPATVNVSGFTIDGKGLGPDNFYGVHFF
ncbi:MAG: right-handed parallel beta-helix repeat-containing protein, partial [Candidatus Zixiibacteriota bacterium]